MKNRTAVFPKAQFSKAIVTSNFRRLSFPFKLSYAVTYRCNLKCKMCNIWKKSHTDTELTSKEVENFFKKANRFSWIGITGGEPFLRNDLAELLDIVIFYCNRLSAVHFATNGQLEDKIMDITSHLHKLNKKLKIVYTISIDGPPLLHDEIRGVEGVWKNAIDAFKHLKEIGFAKAQIGFTLSHSNIDKFEETSAFIKQAYPALRFDDLTVNIFQKSAFYYENQNIQDLDDSRVRKTINKILDMDKESNSINNFLRRTYLRLYLKYMRTNKCPLKCQALSSTCFLDPYGNLYPCTVYHKKLLNVRDMNDTLESIWDSEPARKLSYECSNYMCPSCWTPCDAYSAIAGSLLPVAFSKS